VRSREGLLDFGKWRESVRKARTKVRTLDSCPPRFRRSCAHPECEETGARPGSLRCSPRLNVTYFGKRVETRMKLSDEGQFLRRRVPRRLQSAEIDAAPQAIGNPTNGMFAAPQVPLDECRDRFAQGIENFQREETTRRTVEGNHRGGGKRIRRVPASRSCPIIKITL
jgi:hypothetical protein